MLANIFFSLLFVFFQTENASFLSNENNVPTVHCDEIVQDNGEIICKKPGLMSFGYWKFTNNTLTIFDFSGSFSELSCENNICKGNIWNLDKAVDWTFEHAGKYTMDAFRVCAEKVEKNGDEVVLYKNDEDTFCEFVFPNHEY